MVPRGPIGWPTDRPGPYQTAPAQLRQGVTPLQCLFGDLALLAQRPHGHRPAIVPSSRGDRLPVLLLGKHITALGALRVLARDGIEVLGVEETTDVITRSRWYRPAETRIPETTDPAFLADSLRRLPLPRAVLIACSDRWTQAVAGLPLDVRERFPASISSAAV